MTKREAINLFKNIKVWKRGGQRAPHKSLLLLYALGKCQIGEDRLIPFSKTDQSLRSLLIDFGPPRKSYHPEYPFWRLQNDGIWELPNSQLLKRRKSSTDAKKSELLKSNIHGGFTQKLYHKLHKILH